MTQLRKFWILTALMALCLCGCGLSPEQAAAHREYSRAVAELEPRAEELQENYDELLAKYKAAEARIKAYEDEAKAVLEKLKNKELPVEEAKALYEEIKANVDQDKVVLADLADEIVETKDNLVATWDTLKEVKGHLAELKALEVPWWYYVGPIASVLLNIVAGGGWLKNSKRAGAAVEMCGTLIRGIENAKDTDVKECVSKEAAYAGVGVALHKLVKEITERGG